MDKYYRLVPRNLGEIKRFLPNGYYEPVDDEGFYLEDEPFSQHLEVCFGKSIERCLYGLGNWLKACDYYIYETETAPCLDLDIDGNWYDYRVTGEVRYRKPVESFLIGKLSVSKEMKESYVELGLKISNGLKDVEVLLEEANRLGKEVKKTFVHYPNQRKFQKTENVFKKGERIYMFFSGTEKSKPFSKECFILKTYESSSGIDLFIEDSEGRYWVHADDKRLGKTP